MQKIKNLHTIVNINVQWKRLFNLLAYSKRKQFGIALKSILKFYALYCTQTI